MEKETLSVRINRRIKQRVVELINKGIPATVLVENALYNFLYGWDEFTRKYEDCTEDFEAAFATYMAFFMPQKAICTPHDKVKKQYIVMQKYFEKKRRENGNHKEND